MKIWIFTTLICSFGLGMSVIDASKKPAPVSGKEKEKEGQAVVNKEETIIDIIAEEAIGDLNETAQKLRKGAEGLQQGAKELGDIAEDAKSFFKNVDDIGKIFSRFSSTFKKTR